MKKRIVALLLVFTIICSLPVSATTELSDVTEVKYSRDIEFLNALEIMKGRGSNGFEADASLTRAEMVIILLRTMGIETPNASGVVFSDVPEDHWAYYEVGYAHSLGLINGIGGGLFAPDASVTFNQAIKMIVSLLGYDFMAVGKGGYPAGYQYVANQLDLIDGLSGGSYGEEEIKRGEMAVLIANALETEVAEMYAISSGGSQAETHMEKGKMLMSLYLGVEKVEGTLNAHYYASVSGNLPEETDEVIIGQTLLHTGDNDVVSMLGENVVAYVREESDDDYMILYVERAKGTDVITFTSNDVLSVTQEKITYTLDGRKNNVSFSDVDLYVNGIETLRVSESDLTCAYYKLVENGGEKKKLLINAYTDAVVKSASTTMEMLYLENNVSIDLEDYEKFILKNKDGADISFDSLSAWNIISYYDAQRNGNRIFYGIVTDEAVEGNLISKGDSGNYTELQIGENTYRVSADLFGDIPDLGKKIKFCTNFLGHIAAIDDDISKYTYGYLVAAGRESTFANMQFKIFTHTGEMKLFTAKDKINLNGTPINETDLESKIAIFPSGTTAKKQLIRYELSGTDEIKSIETASDTVITPDDRETFGRNFYAGEKALGRWVNTFASRYIVDESTVYFIVPEPNEAAEDDDYEVFSGQYTEGDLNVYPAYFYDIDEDNVIGAICKIESASTASTLDMGGENIKYGVVTKKKYANRDGDYHPVVTIATTGLSDVADIIIDENEPIRMTLLDENGKAVPNMSNITITNSEDPCYTDAEISFDELDIGDFMMLRLDRNGVAIESRVLVRAKYHDDWESSYGDDLSENYAHSDYRWGRTTVKHISDKGLMGDVEICAKVDGNYVAVGPYERMYIRCDNVLIYDNATGEVSEGTWDEIQEGDEISVLYKIYKPRLMLVYR
ncbi:MAG: S-layer homology domain-containing protein [Clostridia bacterium]|nr:S-layer homology domain-containing protein [Clostridia bacterium]